MTTESQRPTPQEIILTTRTEHRETGVWAQTEKTAKILALIAVPVVLAVVGWQAQENLAIRTVSKDYVALAVSILAQPQETNVDPSLRSWAVDLLNANSPTKFSSAIVGQLKSGEITFPAEQTSNLQYLARHYMDEGNYSKAESTLREALELQAKEFGFNHPATAATLANLGALYFAMGEYNEAESMYLQALKITEMAMGNDHPGTARLLTELAALYEDLGQKARAKDLREKASKIYKKLQPTK